MPLFDKTDMTKPMDTFVITLNPLVGQPEYLDWSHNTCLTIMSAIQGRALHVPPQVSRKSAAHLPCCTRLHHRILMVSHHPHPLMQLITMPSAHLPWPCMHSMIGQPQERSSSLLLYDAASYKLDGMYIYI